MGVGPVGKSRDHERTTVIKREEPRRHTTVIKNKRKEPADKVMIKRDHG